MWGPRRHGGIGANKNGDSTIHLALYKYDSCGFCQRVFRAIDGLDVQIEYRDVQADASWRQDLQSRTGRTTVPCLVVDEQPMFESGDIIQWLQEHFKVKA